VEGKVVETKALAMKALYVIRGVSGSGKTPLAKKYAPGGTR
jgi:hypothetical protein